MRSGVLALLALALGGVGLWLALGPEASLRAEPATGPAAPDEPSDAPGQRVPGEGARVELSVAEVFDERMRARWGDEPDQALEMVRWELHAAIFGAAMAAGQPRIASGAAPVDDGSPVPNALIVYRGPDADGTLRRFVLPEEEHRELYAKRREVLWLEAELSRRAGG